MPNGSFTVTRSRPSKYDEIQEVFRQARPKPGLSDFFGPNPLPPPPTGFQTDPLIQGDEQFVNEASRLVNLDPYVKQNTRKIILGPTKASGEFLAGRGLPNTPEEYGQNLGGIYDSRNKEISVGPNQELGILAHELTHATGYKHPGYNIPGLGFVGWMGEDDPAERARKLYIGPSKGIYGKR